MQNKIAKIIKIILLIFGAFLMVFPFVWMLATSLKTLPEATAIPPIMFPKEAQFSNYASGTIRTLFEKLPDRIRSWNAADIGADRFVCVCIYNF